jgi:hypothetical protein
MKLKQKKNLEPLKGNAFATLHIDSLNQLANDMNLQLGIDTSDAASFINKLIDEENMNYDKICR